MRLDTNRWTVASTAAGAVVALVFLMAGAWLLVRPMPTTGAGDEIGLGSTSGADLGQLAAGADASSAARGSGAAGSDDGSSSVTSPSSGDLDPIGPGNPGLDPDPGPPDPDPGPPDPDPGPPEPEPENQPPTIADVEVVVADGDVIATVVTTDPDANLAALEVASQLGSGALTPRVLETAELEAGRNRIKTRIDTGIDVGRVGRATIDIAIQVTDTDGARDDTQVRHEYVRRVEVTVSPIVMTLDAGSACFQYSTAQSLSGQVVVAGRGIDASAPLGGEFRSGQESLTVLDQQVGVVEGGRDWFVLVTLTPDLTSVGGGVTSLGKIQTLHNPSTSGPIVTSFAVDGCRGSIAYAVDAQIVHPPAK